MTLKEVNTLGPSHNSNAQMTGIFIFYSVSVSGFLPSVFFFSFSVSAKKFLCIPNENSKTLKRCMVGVQNGFRVGLAYITAQF